MREQKREAEGELIRVGNEIQEISKEIAVLNEKLGELEDRARPLDEANREIQSFRKEDADRESDAQKIALRVEGLKSRSETLIEDGKTSRERLGRLEPEVNALEEGVRTGDEECKRLVDLWNHARSLVEGRATTASDLESLEARMEKEKANVEETRDKIEASRKRTGEIVKLRSDKEADLKEIEKELQEIEEGLPAGEEELRKAQFTVASIVDRAKENAKKIEDLNSLSEGSKCPFCEQPISEAHRIKVTTRIKSVILGLLREEETAKVSAKAAEEKLGSLREMTEEIRSRRQSAKDEISAMNLDSTREEQNVSNLEAFLGESESRRDRCGEELKEKRARLEELDGEVQAIRTESKAEGEDWLGELEKLSRKAEEQMTLKRRRLTDLRGEIAAARRILDRATEEGARVKTEIEAGEKSLEELRELIEAERRKISRRFEELIGITDDPFTKVAEMISQIEEEREGKKDALNDKNLTKVQLSNDYRQCENRIAQLVAKIDEYISERDRKEKVKRTYTVFCEARNILQQVRDRYKDAREMIRTNLINVLRELLRVEFEKLYTYEDFHDLKISDDYEVSLQSPVGEIQAHNLSAGQKAITAIAFRLAVAKAMEMKIGCWIIDEPTQNIGKAEVEALADVLADTSKIPQIVIATHHDALGRNGNVISLGVRNGESVLGEGAEPLAFEPRGN
jgi:DNA repair exonuclease SbcCD ATPase subunit